MGYEYKIQDPGLYSMDRFGNETVHFTDEEWAMMAADPIAFGLLLPCGCKPGTCAYPEADCNNFDEGAAMDEYYASLDSEVQA